MLLPLALLASVHSQTGLQEYDLFDMVRRHDAASLKRALSNGAYPFTIKGQDSPLTLVAKSQDPELIQVMVQSPIRREWRRSVFFSLTRYCIELDLSRSVRALSRLEGWKEVRASTLTPLSYAALVRSPKSLSYLAATQDNFQRDELGRLPMHYASMGGPFAIRKLASHPRLLDAQDNEGNTALHYAVRQGQLMSVIELMWLGANPNLKNNRGRTPSDIARGSG